MLDLKHSVFIRGKTKAEEIKREILKAEIKTEAKPIVKGSTKKLPKSVDQAIERLTSELSLTEKTIIVNTPEEELIDLQFTLGEYFRKEFRLEDNDDLMESCRQVSEVDEINVGSASFIIILELWKRLQTIFIFKGDEK